MRSFTGAVAAGTLLAASFPSQRWAWLVWVALCPLLLALPTATAGRRLLYGLTTGFLWSFLDSRTWMVTAIRESGECGPWQGMLLGIAACIYMSGLFIMVYALVDPWLPAPRWLSRPSAWIILEWAELHALGTPMMMLGHPHHGALLAQSAELIGVPGLSFLTMMASAALVARGRERAVGLAVTTILVTTALGFGDGRVHATQAPEGPLRLVTVSGQNQAPDPVAAYAAATPAGADLTVWPEEAAGELFVDEHPELLRALSGTARARGWLLVGALRLSYGATGKQEFANSATLWSPEGIMAGRYDKHYLVPALENSLLGQRTFTAGAEPAEPLQAGPVRVGPLICWESMFPEPSLSYARQGVDVLANLSSDATVGDGAIEHIAITTFRAIETRRWLVRASGARGSLAIDPLGHVHATDHALIPSRRGEVTWYARHPNMVLKMAVAMLAALVMREGWRCGGS